MRPQVVADATTHPRFKYFREAGEDPYHSFLGVPIVDRGLLQGVLVVQTSEPRVFSHDDVRMLVDGRRAARADRQRSADARPVRRARASAPVRRSRRTSGGAGTTIRRACSASSIPVLWREFDHNPIALLQQIADRQARRARFRSWRCTAASTTRYRRMQEYLNSNAHLGRAPRRRARGRGRWRTSPPSSACTNRCPIYSGGLGILAGDHIKSASDLGIPLVGVGLYYDQGYFRQRLDRDGWQHEDYIDVDSRRLPIQSGASSDGRAGRRVHRHADRHDRGARLAGVGRPQHAVAARFERRRQPAGGSRADVAALRRRRARRASGRSCCSASAACGRSAALGIAPGVVHLNEGHSAFAALELVRQRMASEGIDA